MVKAIVQDRYGPPEKVLKLQEIDKPEVREGEVLVRVRAASIHPDVWHEITGRPYILRLMGAGLLKPKNPVPGTDLSGNVEAVGKNVARFKPGDEVFGETHLELKWRNGGAFAEYATVPQDALALKPEGVTFEQAAAVPNAGYIALLNLRMGTLIEPGQQVLINGAGGGVGSIALQLAKAHGAYVTGVDHTEKMRFIRSLGADRSIDYTREDFTHREERYDLIFDVASNLSLSSCKRVLHPAGVYVFIGHDHFGKAAGRVFGSVPRMLKLVALSRYHPHILKPSGSFPKKQDVMAQLKALLEAGKLTPFIDRTFPLGEVPQAICYLIEGRARGRIIITP